MSFITDQFIKKIYNFSYPTCCSNWNNPGSINTINEYGILLKKFTSIVNNYDKTSYYQELLTEFSVNPHEVLVVGDKFEGDLFAAKNLGMKTVHFMHGRGKINPPSLESVDYQIDNILKVQEIVKELTNLSK